jgi:Uncharacterized integral membrane protein
MKNQWRIILGLVLALLIVIFAVINTMEVKLNFGFSEITAPLIIVVIGSAFVGAVIMALVATGTIWQKKREIKQLNKKITALQQEVDKKFASVREEVAKEYQEQVTPFESQDEPKENENVVNTDWHG